MESPELKAELRADQRALRRTRRRARRERQRRLGALVIPSLFTFANLLCGFVAITLALRGRFELAAGLIFLGAVCDLFDGRLARMLNTSTKFGVELDSLADLSSFCLAPALIAWQWELHTLGRLGTAVCFFYLMAGAGRLARFNVISMTGGKRYFVGLPTPPPAGLIMIVIYLWPQPPQWPGFAEAFAGVMFIQALLMVSTLPFRTFKDIHFGRHHPLVWLMSLAAFVMLLLWKPGEVLLTLLTIFIFLSPIIALARRLTGHPSPFAAAAADPSGTTPGNSE